MRRPTALAATIVALVAIALCVLAPLRVTTGDAAPARLGGAVLRCGGGFDLETIDWMHGYAFHDQTPYYAWVDQTGAMTSIFGPAPSVIGALALLDFGDDAWIQDTTLRLRERDAAAVLLGVSVALLVIAAAARTSWRRAALTGLVAAASFAGAATLGQALWQASVAMPALTGALATLAWRERIPRVQLATPALLLLAAMLRPTIAPLAVGLGIAWLCEARGWRTWLAAAGLALVVVSPLVIWNVHHLASPFPIAQFEANTRFTNGHSFRLSPGGVGAGVAGLLVSPGRGLLWFAPIAILGVWMALRRSTQRVWRIVALAVVFQIIAMGTFYKWHGGLAYGPRLIAEATWIAIWLALGAGLASRRVVMVVAVVITVIVGQLGLWRFHAEQWESRRAPDDNESVLWDFWDSPIPATLDAPELVERDSPPVDRMHCLKGYLYTFARPPGR